MKIEITDEIIDYIGILSKLELNDEEKHAAKRDMNNMLGYVDMLNELDTDGVEPMINVFSAVPTRVNLSYFMGIRISPFASIAPL